MKNLLFKILFLSSSVIFSQQIKKELSIDSLTNKMNKSEGFINTYLDEKKLYLEINKEVVR